MIVYERAKDELRPVTTNKSLTSPQTQSHTASLKPANVVSIRARSISKSLFENVTVCWLFLSVLFICDFDISSSTCNFPTFVLHHLSFYVNELCSRQKQFSRRKDIICVLLITDVQRGGEKWQREHFHTNRNENKTKDYSREKLLELSHSKNLYVLSCFPFFENFRQKKEDLFQSMNRSLCEYKLPEVHASLPKKKKSSVGLWSQNCRRKT